MNIKLLVDGGAMKPGPAVAQKLGPAGVPVNKVIEEVNKATQEFKGMQVPVEIEVDLGTKTFEIEVFSPPISGLLKKEAGVEKGSGLQAKQNVANLSIEQIIKVAKSKMGNLLCNDLKSAVKTTIGSCTSLGILVENKPASEVGEDVDSGKYDKEIENEITETPEEKRKELDSYFNQLKAEQDKQLKLENKGEEEASEKK
jgi:large subunit ribosomal protein L11